VLLDTAIRRLYKYNARYRIDCYLRWLAALFRNLAGCGSVGAESSESAAPNLVVNVEFFGVITSALKGRTIRVSLPGGQAPTYRDVLEIMAGDEGSTAREQLFGEREERLRAIRIIAGGRLVSSLDDPVPLGEPMLRIVVLSAVGGG
jgi:hypothetical protein